MTLGPGHDTKQRRLDKRPSVFRTSAVVAAVCAVFLLLSANGAERDLPRNTLWEVVHNLCVPGQSEHHNPKPCLQVDLDGGIESGFAILPDARGGAHFLLVPTKRISGIESPVIREPHARNYFADAWEVRTYLTEALHQMLPQDGVGLAINSAVSRSHDQLHIHLSCIRPDVLEALRKNEGKIVGHWAPLRVPLIGHHYMAMWLTGEDLRPYNPFRLVAERLPNARQDMGNRTIVVVGFTRTDGTKGFVLLAGKVNEASGDIALGEGLLDYACQIAATENKAHDGLFTGRK